MSHNQLNILYFASFREKLRVDQEQIDLASMSTLADLIRLLASRGAVWEEIFGSHETLLMTINQTMAKPDSRIQADDEIAFFPPVTGG